jgi:hypothetical protein
MILRAAECVSSRGWHGVAVIGSVELIRALNEQAFDRLLDTPESDTIDFKTTRYELDQPRGRWELAKDVTAFANARGGVIVLGVETQRNPNDVVERASAIRPLRKRLVNTDQCRDVIAGWIHPMVRDFRCHWFSPDPAVDEGLLLLEVPAQREEDKYFVVRRMIDEGGRQIEALGIPVRDGAGVRWISAETAQGLIADGLTSRRMDVAGALVRDRHRDEQLQRADELLDQIEQTQGWRELPMYALQALPPPGPDRLSGFLSDAGLTGALRRPTELRRHGFTIYSGEVERHRQALVSQSAIKSLRLEPDGLLTFATVATDDIGALGHAVNDMLANTPRAQRRPPLVLNTIALVEMTLESFLFVDRELRGRAAAGQWSFRVVCLRLRGQVGLDPGQRNMGPRALYDPWVFGRLRDATDDDWRRTIADRGDAAMNAFAALEEVYALFGVPPEDIAFADGARIVAQRIRDIPL